MIGAAVVYTGFAISFFGALAAMRKGRRRRGLAVATSGIAVTVLGFLLPAAERRAQGSASRLDHFAPVWQFHEVHTIDIAAPPEKVYEAVRSVRANEIRLFRTLTWIRRGGRDLPESILNAGDSESLIDVALKGGFISLAEEPPRELVIGTVIAAPRGVRGELTPDVFLRSLPPGFTLAAMNFAVIPDGHGGSHVSTETRVFANSDAGRRRFATYWRLIYPGSALIRRMWLRAIARRAVGGAVQGG